MLTGLTSSDLEKIESTLLPRILSAIENAPFVNLQASNDEASHRSNAERTAVNNVSYANVTRQSTNSSTEKKKSFATERATTTSDSRETAPITPDHAGQLRSGKRQIILPGPNVAATSTLDAPQSLNSSTSLTQQRNSSTLTKIEQTVLFKPNKEQSAEQTKSDICAKLDPVAFAVKDVRLREFGEVAVRCGTKELALNLIRSATPAFSEKYNVELQKPLKPRIKIIGFSDEMSEESLLDKLKTQNSLLNAFDLKVIRITKNEKRKSKHAILETDARGFDTLMKLQRVYLGWERCRIVDATDAIRCFNCTEFRHKAATCTKPTCCPKCACDHKAEDCHAGFERCINCHLKNAKLKPVNDVLLDVAHCAWSFNCPTYRKHLAKARQQIDFSS